LDETVQFSDAINLANLDTDEKDTLIVVTADHSHTMSFSGYPKRGTNILSLAGVSDVDNMPYSTLSYANGPGYRKTHGKTRHNLLDDNMGW
jgi:alkaline phosphatase